MVKKDTPGGENLPNHDVEQDDSGNNAAFDVIIDGEGEHHGDDEDLF